MAPCAFSTLMLAALQASCAADNGATLVVGGKPVAFVVSPFVGDDGQVYAPVDFVRLLGGNYEPNQDGRTVSITAANGARTTIAYRFMQQRYCVPVQQLGSVLGATESWDAEHRTLTLRAKLLMVRQDNDSLNIYTSYPTYYHVQRIDHPSRLFVDLYGVDLAASPAQIPATNPDVTQIRTGKMDLNTARVVIDLRHDVKFHVDTPIATNHVRVALSGGPILPITTPPVVKPPVVAARPNDNAGTPGGELPVLPVTPVGPMTPTTTPPAAVPVSQGGPLKITSIAVNPLSDTVTQVIVKATGSTRYRTVALTGPNRLALDLAGAGLQEGLQDITGADGNVVNAVRSGIIHAGQNAFGRVVIDLSKAVDYSITTQVGPDGTTYLVNLETGSRLTPNPNGPLRGKIVMVDPGHGGGDSGAIGIGGVREKDVTLEIGKRLSDVLRSNGATVYMTRDGDTLPSVRARPQMAVSVNADYFISVHCDESGPANSHSGTTVYYHAHNPVCKRLAADISKQIGQVCAIPPLGTKSDTIRFQTGFGVLRGSPMPAVLVETGYINSARDLAKLVDPAVQQNIADGIVAGLIDFVAERGGE